MIIILGLSYSSHVHVLCSTRVVTQSNLISYELIKLRSKIKGHKILSSNLQLVCSADL